MNGFGYQLPPSKQNQDFIINNSVPVKNNGLVGPDGNFYGVLHEGDWVLALFYGTGWCQGILAKNNEGGFGFAVESGTYCDLSHAAEVRYIPSHRDATKTVKTPPHYMVRVHVSDKCGRFESNIVDILIDEELPPDNSFELAGKIEGIERMILALACAGVDVTSDEFGEAVGTVLEALENEID